MVETSPQLLRRMFRVGVDAVHPKNCVPSNLPPAPKGRTVVVGAGKASAAMARAVEDHWDGDLSGLVVTRHGYVKDCRKIDIVEAGHPNPSASGMEAAERMLRIVHGLTPDDLVLALISGGGSALLPCPASGLTFDDEQHVNELLLYSGASISEMNCVRKHVSRIKGGRLALAAAPARVVTLIVSDIPNDIASDVASGPTIADPTTAADALAVLAKYDLEAPANVVRHLRSGTDETPKPNDPRLANSENRIIARARDALAAAAMVARSAGIEPVDLGDNVEGEAREVAKEHAIRALQCADGTEPEKLPCVLLSGGETTVKVRNREGKGGRNSEYALALAIALDGRRGICALAADTDGVDGTEDNAGAFITPDTLRHAIERGLDPADYLVRNDAYSFFRTLDDLFKTGPTFTNVNDFRAILIEPAR